MTTQDLINTLKQGRPMTDRLVREIVRELEGKNEQLYTMGTALRAKDADYAAMVTRVEKLEKVARILIGCIEDSKKYPGINDDFEDELEAGRKALEG